MTPLPPQITLVVSGVDRLTVKSEGNASSLVSPLRGLLSESLGTGIQIILGGSPQVANSSLLSTVGRRFIFSVDIGEQRSLAVNRSISPSTIAGRRRFYDTKTNLVSQFVSLGETEQDDLAASVKAIESIADAPGQGPKPVADVPWPLPMSHVVSGSAPPEFRAPLAIGVETANGSLSYIDGEYDGPALIVAGPPRSGRTCTLAAIAELAVGDRWTVIAYDHWGRSDLREMLPSDAEVYRDPDECRARLEDAELDERLLMLVDDIDRVRDVSPIDAAKERDGVCFILGSGGMGTVDRVRCLREVSGHVLLSPTGNRDGFPLIRSIPDGLLVQKPGRGVFFINESLIGIQVPLPGRVGRQ